MYYAHYPEIRCRSVDIPWNSSRVVDSTFVIRQHFSRNTLALPTMLVHAVIQQYIVNEAVNLMQVSVMIKTVIEKGNRSGEL